MPSKVRIIFLLAITLFTTSKTFKISERIFKGARSERNQFPYYVFLEQIVNLNLSKNCGASLISNEWVISAAHCVTEGKVILLHFGLHETRNLEEPGRQIQMIDARKNTFIHPGYSTDDIVDDIALIKLAQPIQFSSSIQPIKFSAFFDPEEEVNVDTIAIGTGFVKGGQDLSDYVEWLSLKTTPKTRCEEVFPFLANQKTIICVENGLGSVTSGDSGGPLVRMDDNSLLGISCFNHINTSLTNDEKYGAVLPQAFTNVGYYKVWIKYITDLSFD